MPRRKLKSIVRFAPERAIRSEQRRTMLLTVGMLLAMKANAPLLSNRRLDKDREEDKLDCRKSSNKETSGAVSLELG